MFSGMHYVYAVYQYKSFSKAAQALYISQPALSASVKRVEQEIGMPLFDRSKNPLRLTECGERYIAAAQQMLRIEEDFTSYVNALKNIMGGTLSIGASTFYTTALLPRVLQSFSSAHPDVAIRLTEGNVSELEKQLFDGDIDFAIEANEFDEKIFDKQRIYHEHLVLVVPKSFSINEKLAESRISGNDIKSRRHVQDEIKPVNMSLLKGEPFILLREGNDIRIRADKIFKAASLKPRIVLTVDHMLTAHNLASSGLGITLICDTLLHSLPVDSDDACCYYKLDNSNIHRNVYFYHKKTKYLTPAMQAFYDMTKESFAPLLP